MPEHKDLPTHWLFALRAAFARLERLVWDFDFTDEAGDHAYVGVQEPEAVIGIIDGFLGEPEYLFGGDITKLEQMRAVLQATITPAYHAGQAAARQYWVEVNPKNLEQIERRTERGVAIAEAWRRVPAAFGPSTASWFVEGFCRADGEEWMKAVIESESIPPPPSPLSPL